MFANVPNSCAPGDKAQGNQATASANLPLSPTSCTEDAPEPNNAKRRRQTNDGEKLAEVALDKRASNAFKETLRPFLDPIHNFRHSMNEAQKNHGARIGHLERRFQTYVFGNHAEGLSKHGREIREMNKRIETMEAQFNLERQQMKDIVAEVSRENTMLTEKVTLLEGLLTPHVVTSMVDLENLASKVNESLDLTRKLEDLVNRLVSLESILSANQSSTSEALHDCGGRIKDLEYRTSDMPQLIEGIYKRIDVCQIKDVSLHKSVSEHVEDSTSPQKLWIALNKGPNSVLSKVIGAVETSKNNLLVAKFPGDIQGLTQQYTQLLDTMKYFEISYDNTKASDSNLHRNFEERMSNLEQGLFALNEQYLETKDDLRNEMSSSTQQAPDNMSLTQIKNKLDEQSMAAQKQSITGMKRSVAGIETNDTPLCDQILDLEKNPTWDTRAISIPDDDGTAVDGNLEKLDHTLYELDQKVIGLGHNDTTLSKKIADLEQKIVENSATLSQSRTDAEAIRGHFNSIYGRVAALERRAFNYSQLFDQCCHDLNLLKHLVDNCVKIDVFREAVASSVRVKRFEKEIVQLHNLMMNHRHATGTAIGAMSVEIHNYHQKLANHFGSIPPFPFNNSPQPPSQQRALTAGPPASTLATTQTNMQLASQAIQNLYQLSSQQRGNMTTHMQNPANSTTNTPLNTNNNNNNSAMQNSRRLHANNSAPTPLK